MDALLSWSAWPDFIKETLDPSETSKALARHEQSRAASSTGPDTSPDIDLMYVIPASMHGKHGSALGKIHTIDPVETLGRSAGGTTSVLTARHTSSRRPRSLQTTSPSRVRPMLLKHLVREAMLLMKGG
jgi:hypothetical protein